MDLMRKAWRYISDKDYRFLIAANKGKYDDMPDDEYLKHIFRARMGYDLHLENPKTFNEKMQWLKLYDRNPAYTTMVDKAAVKSFVADKIGTEYVIPTIGVWDNVEAIDFGILPDQFVLKCTHDSQGNVICREKRNLDVEAVKIKLNRCLKRDYYKKTREWPYKDVPHRIIAEQYLEDGTLHELRDYKLFCFDGIVKVFKIDFDRFINHKANYYTAEGELIQLGEKDYPPNPKKEIVIPESIGKMKELAGTLSQGIPFVRVDFYDVDGKIFFGEMTFYPASGLRKYLYEGNDEMLGSWISLPRFDNDSK